MRVLKKTICIFWCLVLINTLQAQRIDTSKTQQQKKITTSNSVGFKVGYDRSYLKDINFSPLNYKGNGNVIDINYKRNTKNKSLFFSQLDFTSTTLTSKAPTSPTVSFDSDRFLVNIEIGFLKKINLNNKKINLYIGGAYHTYLDLTFYKGFNSITYFATHGLDLTNCLTYQVHPRHKLEANFSISVLALLVRPPYSGWDKFIDEKSAPQILVRGKWTSLNDFVGTNLNLTYVFELTHKWNIETQYRLRFYKTNHLKLAKIATSQTSLGVNFKF